MGLYRTTPEGQIVDANPALMRMLGYPDRQALLAANATDLYVDPEDRGREQALVEREGVVRDFEMQLRRHDGTIIWVRDSARAVRDGDDRVLYYESSVEDMTERKRAEEALKSTALETLEAVSSLVEASDPYTAGHSARVTEVALAIATEMGLGEDQSDTLRIAGPLHDVGKVGIPSSVLNKPSGLTQAEWLMIQSHPGVSAQMSEQVTAFREAVPAIRHHHERWDGTGYPDGLQEEDIPLLARILAVADGFEAMTSERPYRRALTEEEALAELQKGAGTQWDPEVVKLFLKLRKPPTKRKGKGKKEAQKVVLLRC